MLNTVAYDVLRNIYCANDVLRQQQARGLYSVALEALDDC
jgi:hypothetical protein